VALVTPHGQLGFLVAAYKTSIDALIALYLANLGSDSRLKQACAYALSGDAKRFRPALVQMVAKALGRPGQADEAALAIEFFHTASLIADDLPCMDDEEFRRNRPTLHRVYGEATALLASYALISAGYSYVEKNSRRMGGRGAARALENIAFNTGIEGATGGQWLDLCPPDLTRATLLEMIKKKTVSLFEVAFVLGWIFGGGDERRLDVVKQAAAHFGLAFQIADDLGDQEQDLANGCQVNLVAVFGREEAVQMFQQEIAEYRAGLVQLNIASGELQQLAQWVETQVNQSLASC